MSLAYDCYEAGDECGVSSETAEVVKLAVEGSDEDLAAYTLQQLEEAQLALRACRRWGCDNHGSDRHAFGALEHAISNEMARLEELDQAEADARQHGGACGCGDCQ